MTDQRQFAVEVVAALREAGFVAYWAGGCVRDQLLGKTPKDYDVATDAQPDEIRNLFGQRRTLALGAAFGVITVLGRKNQGQIEVATFRQDAAYSDGRHPDDVTFSDAEHDAQRRDFTINGLFYDPIAEKVIDYVGGQQDLAEKVLRAIGDPAARIDEDKLRMLRAVRFAATYDLAIDPATLSSIQQHASDIHIVSAERIAEEMRRMLGHARRAQAVELLYESRLLAEILPETAAVADDHDTWPQLLRILEQLGPSGTFSEALAAALRWTVAPDASPSSASAVEAVAQRWRLSNDERRLTTLLLRHEALIRRARRTPWPAVQRVLILEDADQLLNYAAAVSAVMDNDTRHVDFCRAKLSEPPEVLDPPPLITGDDLREAGVPPGRIYQQILTAVRDAQLEGKVETFDDALQAAVDFWRGQKPP